MLVVDNEANGAIGATSPEMLGDFVSFGTSFLSACDDC